jgi:3-phosphoshikimate 1-carboxyvinyltransferase
MIRIGAGLPGGRHVVVLPRSKSISNRALIISAVSGGTVDPGELSEAADTLLMQQLLRQDREQTDPVLDAGNAGTVMRFLTAYLAATPGSRTLTGDERMQQRPIAPLVEALRGMGAAISYTGRQGFAPLHIEGRKLRGGTVTMDGGISSQFVSALMMIAPLLDGPLKIQLEGPVVSEPYIGMTASLMRIAGLDVQARLPLVKVPCHSYKPATLPPEPDWSSAAPWYSMVALREDLELLIKDLDEDSLQGDRVLADHFRLLGVETEKAVDGLRVYRGTRPEPGRAISFDLRDCPDLAPSLIVTVAALGMEGHFSGLSTLPGKESDRLQALQAELGKAGIRCSVDSGSLSFIPQAMDLQHPVDPRGDHRIAMAFAPLAANGRPVTIMDPEVVEKSYPGFWGDERCFR